MEAHAIILFDGVCNFCNGAVNFVIRHDGAGYFHFAPLQSATAGELCDKLGVSAEGMSTFILIENGRAYTKSTAALRVARRLGFPVNLLYAGMIIPRVWRDGIYSWIAGNRYRWFGRNDACMVPTAEVRSRFIM